MPGIYGDGWNDGFSNVVCIKTKPRDAPDSAENTVHQIKPIQRTRFKRLDRSFFASELPSELPEKHQSVWSSTTPGYKTFHGTSHLNFTLKAPEASSSNYYVTQLPPRPKRQSVVTFEPRLVTTTHVQRFSPSPVELKSESLSGSLSFPSMPVSRRTRSSSLPPPVSSAHARRYSVSSSDYARNISGSGLKRTSVYGYTNNEMDEDFKKLRAKTQDARNKLEQHRSVVDPYYLPTNDSRFNGIYNFSEPPGRRPAFGRYRSLSVSSSRRPSISAVRPAASNRSPSMDRYDRYDTALNIGEDFSQLRTKTQDAKKKLEQHRSMVDPYLITNDSRFNGSYKFSELPNRRPAFERYRSSSVLGFRRPSISGTWSAAANRASSLDRYDTALNSHSIPKFMSDARRKIRQVLYKVSGDSDYYYP